MEVSMAGGLDKNTVRLLELYVLWCIGELGPRENKIIKDQVTPELQNTYRRTGQWHEILAQELGFAPGLAAEVRKIWVDNSKAVAGQSIKPKEFAQMFVAENFSA
jgi:hypothetical protein